MNKSITLTSIFIIFTLFVGGCDGSKNVPTSSEPAQQPAITPKNTELPEGKADKDDAKTMPTTPPATTTKSSEAPVPVPAAPLPKADPRAVPDVDDLNEKGAIAKSYQAPDISGTIIPYLITNQQNLGVCKDNLEPDLAKTASNVYRVGTNKYLVHFACGVSAYQAIQEYYLYENTNDQPVVTSLPLTHFYGDLNGELVQSTERTMAGFSDYNPATQTINIFTKDRGLGDCGSLGFYKFTGTELKLEKFLAKNECDGKYVDPINYPQVYP